MKKLSTQVLLFALAASATAAGTKPPRFIENDYARALAEARQRKVPLFVEMSAPW